MKYIYINEFGEIVSTVETGNITNDLPIGAILFPDTLDFSKALDYGINPQTKEFILIDKSTRPSIWHLYDYAKGEWILQTNLAIAAMRNERDTRLATMDAIISNPLRWAEMDEKKQAEWVVYRRALLDITAKPGFPFEITWPAPPT
jgi:hypothetical protein